jgi:hypothetical protein
MMNENQPEDIYKRTKAFALRVIKRYEALPKTTTAQVMGSQVLRCITITMSWMLGSFGLN